jgi:predicted membrane channel-forming protein YqfA (hemolysin III family)
MKKVLSFFAVILSAIVTAMVPILGFAMLEPTGFNLFAISLVFASAGVLFLMAIVEFKKTSI